jgi:septal ring factor EnvC (AmiA/AmiB activator)
MRSLLTKSLIVWLCLATLAAYGVSAQGKETESQKIARQRKESETRLQALKVQMQEYEAKIAAASRDEQKSLQALENIEHQLQITTEIAGQLESAEKALQNEIIILKANLLKAQNDLAVLREDYAKYAVAIYKFGKKRNVEVLLSAGSVNEGLVLTEYMKRFSEQGKLKLAAIQKKQIDIKARKDTLEAKYAEDVRLLEEKRQQAVAYQAKADERKSLITDLRRNKKQFQQQITQEQSSAKDLQNKIVGLIEAEEKEIRAELARKAKAEAIRRMKALADKERADKAAAEGKKSKSSDIALEKPAHAPDANAPLRVSPDDFDYDAVSVDFNANRGQLPWPVKGGVIVQAFGRNENRDLKIVSFNNGVDISVSFGSDVHAVAGGKVTQISWIPNYGNIVLVRHSNSFITVYASLSEVRVAKNETVKSGQVIGLSGKNAVAGSVVHFEVWKGKEKTDPAVWLARKD